LENVFSLEKYDAGNGDLAHTDVNDYTDFVK